MSIPGAANTLLSQLVLAGTDEAVIASTTELVLTNAPAYGGYTQPTGSWILGDPVVCPSGTIPLGYVFSAVTRWTLQTTTRITMIATGRANLTDLTTMTGRIALFGRGF